MGPVEKLSRAVVGWLAEVCLADLKERHYYFITQPLLYTNLNHVCACVCVYVRQNELVPAHISVCDVI